MILCDLKNYIAENKSVSLMDITLHFKIDPELARDMLAHWIRKKSIQQTNKMDECGTECQACHPLLAEKYSLL